MKILKQEIQDIIEKLTELANKFSKNKIHFIRELKIDLQNYANRKKEKIKYNEN